MLTSFQSSLLTLSASCLLDFNALASQADELTDAISQAMILHEDEQTFLRKAKLSAIMQYQVAMVQPNGSNGQHLREGASPMNQEFRRMWLGLSMDFKSATSFGTYWKFGGLPSRESYANGYTDKNYTYAGIFDLWVKQELSEKHGLSLKAGKLKTLFLDDFLTSNTQIKTVERSMLTNQTLHESNWGVEFRWQPKQHSYLFLQALANDRAQTMKGMSSADSYRDGRGLKGEFGWEDKFFVILGGQHRFDEREGHWQQLTFQYTHDFDNSYDNGTQYGTNSWGIGVKDALAFGHHLQSGDWSFATQLLGNFEILKAPQQHGQAKSLGFTFMPVYKINEHVELVARYTFMAGDDGVKLGSDRFIASQTTADTWVDSVHAFYMGANFYYSAKNPNAAKFMLGAEYTAARNDGQSAYTGWTIMSAVRFFF